MNKSWTQREVKWLLTNYEAHTVQEVQMALRILSKIERTPEAIRSQVKRLRKKGMRFIPRRDQHGKSY